MQSVIRGINYYTISANILLLNFYRLLYFPKQTITSKKVFYISPDVTLSDAFLLIVIKEF